MGHRCWRCGWSHQTSKCTLKAKCKKCDRRHLEVLHDVNGNSDSSSKGNIKEAEGSAHPASSTSQTLYLDCTTSGKQVLLKSSRVVIQNGDKSLETYVVLDDESERTILLHEAARHLGLQGTVEDLALHTVRQEVHTIRGNSVSFSIAPAMQPGRSFQIHGAFTAKELDLVQHTYTITDLQQNYCYLRDLALHDINQAHPFVHISSDYPHLIMPLEPVRLGPKGSPAAVRTRLGWTSRFLCPRLQPQECFFVSCGPLELMWMESIDTLHHCSGKSHFPLWMSRRKLSLLFYVVQRDDYPGSKKLAATYNAEIQKFLQAGYINLYHLRSVEWVLIHGIYHTI